MKPSDRTKLEERVKAVGDRAQNTKLHRTVSRNHPPPELDDSGRSPLRARHMLDFVDQQAKALNQLQQGLLEANQAVGGSRVDRNQPPF
jgi:hypothetical protein